MAITKEDLILSYMNNIIGQADYTMLREYLLNEIPFSEWQEAINAQLIANSEEFIAQATLDAQSEQIEEDIRILFESDDDALLKEKLLAQSKSLFNEIDALDLYQPGLDAQSEQYAHYQQELARLNSEIEHLHNINSASKTPVLKNQEGVEIDSHVFVSEEDLLSIERNKLNQSIRNLETSMAPFYKLLERREQLSIELEANKIQLAMVLEREALRQVGDEQFLNRLKDESSEHSLDNLSKERREVLEQIIIDTNAELVQHQDELAKELKDKGTQLYIIALESALTSGMDQIFRGSNSLKNTLRMMQNLQEQTTLKEELNLDLIFNLAVELPTLEASLARQDKNLQNVNSRLSQLNASYNFLDQIKEKLNSTAHDWQRINENCGVLAILLVPGIVISSILCLVSPPVFLPIAIFLSISLVISVAIGIISYLQMFKATILKIDCINLMEQNDDAKKTVRLSSESQQQMITDLKNQRVEINQRIIGLTALIEAQEKIIATTWGSANTEVHDSFPKPSAPDTPARSSSSGHSFFDAPPAFTDNDDVPESAVQPGSGSAK